MSWLQSTVHGLVFKAVLFSNTSPSFSRRTGVLSCNSKWIMNRAVSINNKYYSFRLQSSTTNPCYGFVTTGICWKLHAAWLAQATLGNSAVQEQFSPTSASRDLFVHRNHSSTQMKAQQIGTGERVASESHCWSKLNCLPQSTKLPN